MSTPKKVKRVGWYDPPGVVRRPLPREHLHAFFKEVDRLKARYFEKDEDGDYPVQVCVVDRTDTRQLYYRPLPHTHAVSQAKSFEHRSVEVAERLQRAFQVACSNIEMAVDDLRSVRRELLAEEDRQKKRGAK